MSKQTSRQTSRFKLRFSLRTLILVMTVAFLATPWIASFLGNHLRERKIWNDFVSYRGDRDAALEKWREAKVTNDIMNYATAQHDYYLAVSKMNASFAEIQKFYDFELDSNGTIIGDDTRIRKAKERFDPPLTEGENHNSDLTTTR